MDFSAFAEGIKYEHSRQVSRISGVLAEKAGYSPSERAVIEQAALFHDIGKIAIPKELLNKPGPLTTGEYEIVKTHTDIGYRQIMDVIHMLNIAATLARDHHERINGALGYHGISGENTPAFVKLVVVADVFDSLYSRRPYKSPWSVPDIRAYLIDQSGTQFDPDFVVILLDELEDILKLYDPACNALTTR